MRRPVAAGSERKRQDQSNPASHPAPESTKRTQSTMHDARPALDRALPFAVLVLVLAASMGCSKIPQGRSAVDSVSILDAKHVKASDTEDKLETEASTKFLFLFQGVAFDYSVYDEAVLQRDMA